VYDPVTKTIKNENNKCVDVQWNNSANGTPVWMWDCNGNPAQQWTFVSHPSEKFTIRNANGKCLTAPGGQSQTPLQIWDCDANAASQQWAINGAP
jgi:hypothetical protein